MFFRFATDVLKLEDPDKTWIDLCRRCPDAKANCKTFLEDHLKKSRKWQPNLDPEEEVEVSTINAATSLLELWKCLVVEADDRVLKQKRSQDAQNEGIWQLRWTPLKNVRATGPVHEISIVCVRSLSLERKRPQALTFT